MNEAIDGSPLPAVLWARFVWGIAAALVLLGLRASAVMALTG
jgi:hypothetical protein